MNLRDQTPFPNATPEESFTDREVEIDLKEAGVHPMVIPQILSIANGNPDEFESTIKFNFEINERAMTEETISLVEKAIEGHGADLKKYKWFSTLEANLIIFKMMYKSFNERDAQTIHDEGAPRLEEIRRDFEEKGGLSDFKN